MTVLFYTLGCKVNQYDTGVLQESFLRAGYTPAAKGEAPDVVVINTCTVTAESDRKGRQAIRRFARTYPNAVIAVTGCMPQAVPRKAESLSCAHVIVGNALNEQLPELVEQYRQTGVRVVQTAHHAAALSKNDRCSRSFEGRERAFVKIEDGCNRFCSYCLIPYARGRVRSKPLRVLKEELETLAHNGYREVVLAGINLTAYGQEWDLNLCDAVELAQKTEGIDRIRLGSMEPDQFTDSMIARLAACHKLCPQFHLSLQSGSDRVLARMNRHYDSAFYADLIGRLRQAFPHCAVTTDIMCGFPDETEEEFCESLSFIETVGFAKVHAFVYSPREGTPAAAMKQVPPAVKKERGERLNLAAKQSEQAFLQSYVGKVRPVLFEQVKDDGIYVGHTPEYVEVQVPSEEDLRGQIRDVTLTAPQADGCLGKIVRG